MHNWRLENQSVIAFMTSDKMNLQTFLFLSLFLCTVAVEKPSHAAEDSRPQLRLNRSLEAARRIAGEPSCPVAEPASAEPTDRPQLGWRCVRAVGGVRRTVFCQDRVRWAERCRTELRGGVLIGGKWQDAQSQQQIICLTHVEKLLEGLITLQVFS